MFDKMLDSFAKAADFCMGSSHVIYPVNVPPGDKNHNAIVVCGSFSSNKWQFNLAYDPVHCASSVAAPFQPICSGKKLFGPHGSLSFTNDQMVDYVRDIYRSLPDWAPACVEKKIAEFDNWARVRGYVEKAERPQSSQCSCDRQQNNG